MENEFLLSIIIPTKNRKEYAVKVIEQILQINDKRLQIVLQDNSDTNDLYEMLTPYKGDFRLKYNYTKGVLSFVDNFSIAVSIADGEYICIIGDDDGIVPQILDVTEWAKNNDIDAIKPELSAVFYWPNSESVKDKKDNGNMSINNITCMAETSNPYNEVIKLLKNGCLNYLSFNLVKLYHGIVKREKLNDIRKVTGKYFGGLTPDIYMSIALSLTVKKLVNIDFPLTISGICNKSGSADSVTGRHTGKLEDAPHFRGHSKYNWSDMVPRFYSVETIWADSALAAIYDLGYVELLDYFNPLVLLAECRKKYPYYRDELITYYKYLKEKKDVNVMQMKVNYVLLSTNKLMRRFMRKIKHLKDNKLYISGVDNILVASEILQEKLNLSNININMVIASLTYAINNDNKK